MSMAKSFSKKERKKKKKKKKKNMAKGLFGTHFCKTVLMFVK
jgi:hypothetical protein